MFKIYASGKGSGAIINAQDEIVLYYLQEGLWVGQGYEGNTRKFPGCLGPSRPPPLDRYDGCEKEDLEKGLSFVPTLTDHPCYIMYSTCCITYHLYCICYRTTSLNMHNFCHSNFSIISCIRLQRTPGKETPAVVQTRHLLAC